MQLWKRSEVFETFSYNMSQKKELIHFESVTSKNNWLISVLMASFSIRYKAWGPEKKRNQILIQISLWSGCLKGSSLSVWGSQFLLVHQSLCLRLMMVMAVSLIVHHISVILIYSFCHKSRSLWKNGCPWVIYIIGAHTP